jgi:hypothetical protein
MKATLTMNGIGVMPFLPPCDEPTGPAPWSPEGGDDVVFGVALAVVSSAAALDAARGGGSAGVALPVGSKRHPSTSPLETFHSPGPWLAYCHRFPPCQ